MLSDRPPSPNGAFLLHIHTSQYNQGTFLTSKHSVQIPAGYISRNQEAVSRMYSSRPDQRQELYSGKSAICYKEHSPC